MNPIGFNNDQSTMRVLYYTKSYLRLHLQIKD